MLFVSCAIILAAIVLQSTKSQRNYRSRAMPELASEIADSIRALADAVDRFAGVCAWGAVQEHSDTHHRQKEMAAVVLQFAKRGFFTTKVDGIKVSEADEEMLDKMLAAVFPSYDPKKAPRR